MRALVVPTPGGPEALTLTEVDDLPIGPNEIRIRVAAAGVNRADVAQRHGTYPPPPGAPSWPGLEVSGEVIETGSAVTRFSLADRVCALLAGGGYATEAVVHEDLALAVPTSLDLIDAAALPEALATVWSNVFLDGGLKAGDTLLVHGGASGIGTTATQLGTLAGARVAVTAGSAQKLELCRQLGAQIMINYHEQDFTRELNAATSGHGADVILDIIGGAYASANIEALAMNGRIMLIANQSGVSVSFDPRALMAKRGLIHGTTLRSRPLAEKVQIMRAVRLDAWPWVEFAQLHPVIDSRFSFADAVHAHRRMEASAHAGKILLVP